MKPQSTCANKIKRKISFEQKNAKKLSRARTPLYSIFSPSSSTNPTNPSHFQQNTLLFTSTLPPLCLHFASTTRITFFVEIVEAKRSSPPQENNLKFNNIPPSMEAMEAKNKFAIRDCARVRARERSATCQFSNIFLF